MAAAAAEVVGSMTRGDLVPAQTPTSTLAAAALPGGVGLTSTSAVIGVSWLFDG